MNIYQLLTEAEHKNLAIMHLAAELDNSVGQTIELSNKLFIDIIQHMKLQDEQIDYKDYAKQNASIIAMLANSDITPEEAAAQSNSLWIGYINKLRQPGEPLINTLNFRAQTSFHYSF